ncbi:laminin subunit gamma-3 [Arapaima gigas]
MTKKRRAITCTPVAPLVNPCRLKITEGLHSSFQIEDIWNQWRENEKQRWAVILASHWLLDSATALWPAGQWVSFHPLPLPESSICQCVSVMKSIHGVLFFICFCAGVIWGAMDSCLEDGDLPSRCMPRFENAAFGRTVEASNTCGSPPEDYCAQTGSARSCRHCDAADPLLHHNATYLTDFHSDEEPTWWQSQSMYHGVQYPQSINLTLRLGKAFEITYVRLKFHTSRPESFAIYKRTHKGGPWLPYQYYSASCWKTYGKDPKGFLQPGHDERMALCTDEFSDISPLTGGNVAFSTLEGRPSAYNFDQSPVLQEWVTATDILISLNRLNTFGDEFFKDANVLRSYYYAISDFSVGGRCKCNGHANECVPDEHGELVCACQHHTAGADCQDCQPFYRDRPWARATAESANECVMCNCSGRADTCVFDSELYRSTGSGGRCVGCQDNTDGPHCEHCKVNFHRSSPQDVCRPCDCNSLGSLSLQCADDGRCHCRQTVTGEKCDSCRPGFHTMEATGCRPCECHSAGSIGVCSPVDGHCHCRINVEGHACDRCKPGFFNLAANKPSGCEACFCFGHSVACSSASQYTAINITSEFMNDPDGWVGEFREGRQSSLIWKEGEVYLLPHTEDDIGFYRAPQKFLGNQLLSYGQLLSFAFVAEDEELLPKRVTVVLEGSEVSVSAELRPEPGPSHPHFPEKAFVLRLHEGEERLTPPLSVLELRRLLFNLTAFKISNAGGLNYTSQLSWVSLVSAKPLSTLLPADLPPAPWVEQCTCPLGFEGQFCEHCTPGYKREVPNGGPFAQCVPCTCNQHGECHPETGVCQCTDFTTGPTCERCLDGYYGNPLAGGPEVCEPCPCPGQTACAQVPHMGEVVCTNCPVGQRGTRCEMCDDGFYGDPLGRHGEVRPCIPCDCSGNTDPNAVGTCDHLSGRCLKCLYHTEGDRCERCQRGYYGDALDHSTGAKCKPCVCSPDGSAGSPGECHTWTGQCQCLAHVTGRDCSTCQVGYFNLRPGLGCKRCTCNPSGSSSTACHPVTGQCTCHPGVAGLSCDSCRAGFFGLSTRGCRACNCDPMGSVTMQCHQNGTCICREGFTGYKCDKCQLNYFHNRVTHQCEECPLCYSLVKDQAEKLRMGLQSLEKLLALYDCKSWHSSHRQALQGEDPLPNTLMDLLAIQDAKEAFVNQFIQLETSAHAVEAQLHGFAAAMNCSFTSEGEEELGLSRLCRAIAGSITVVDDALVQLRQTTATLDGLVIPFEVQKGPNQWTALVNESRVLQKGHAEVAGYIEAVAKKALMTSNQTYILLRALLEDDSTEQFIGNLTQQLLEMQQTKENLTTQVNVTLLESRAASKSTRAQWSETMDTFSNLTSSLRLLESELEGAQGQTKIVHLANRTQELDLLIQSKDKLVSEVYADLEPHVKSVEDHLKTLQEYDQLTDRAEEAKVAALSAVISGKETESEASVLLRNLEDMEKTWPQTMAQTQDSLSKETTVEGKILAEARKMTSEAERFLTPALRNATLANSTATNASYAASNANQAAKGVLSQAKKAKSASAKLSSSIDTTVQQLEEQQHRALQILTKDIANDTDDSVGSMRETIEVAKVQLETHMKMLSDLLGKIAEENDAVERFHLILNDTATRLGILRHSMESPALSRKLQALRDAAQDQQAELERMEQSIREVSKEKHSLQDIALHLPRGCAEASKAGKL